MRRPRASRAGKPQARTHTITCLVCGLRSDHHFNFTQHLRTHTGEKPYQCQDCGKKFARRQNFLNHGFVHREDRAKPHQCAECGRSFVTRSHLNRHAQTHSDDPKRFRCTRCGRGFSETHHLQRHLSVHTGSRPHACTLCDKAFAAKDQLRVHVLDRHVEPRPADLGTGRYRCEPCGIAYKTPLSLRSHRQRLHAALSFDCKLCGRVFGSRGGLRRHRCSAAK